MWTPALSSVATIATTIPTAPIQLPRRAVAGDDRKRSASTKHTIVTRYSEVDAVGAHQSSGSRGGAS